jgi:hypothetical protein
MDFGVIDLGQGMDDFFLADLLRFRSTQHALAPWIRSAGRRL